MLSCIRQPTCCSSLLISVILLVAVVCLCCIASRRVCLFVQLHLCHTRGVRCFSYMHLSSCHSSPLTLRFVEYIYSYIFIFAIRACTMLSCIRYPILSCRSRRLTSCRFSSSMRISHIRISAIRECMVLFASVSLSYRSSPLASFKSTCVILISSSMLICTASSLPTSVYGAFLHPSVCFAVVACLRHVSSSMLMRDIVILLCWLILGGGSFSHVSICIENRYDWS